MNRRDLLTRITGAIAASTGIKAAADTVEETQKPIAFKVTLPRGCIIDANAYARVRAEIARVFEDTPWDKIPVLILMPGMDFQAVTAEDDPCVISERMGDYEWSVKGRTGEEAIEMLSKVAFDSPGWPIVGNVREVRK